MGVNHVKSECKDFLSLYFGTNENSGKNEEFGLRLVCLGNPERTIQAELLHYLRSKNINAISECGISSKDKKRYNLDITIFDNYWVPLCVIEIKHYSANQGRIATLTKNIQSDLERHKQSPQKTLPIVQIGLYSEISHASNPACYKHGFYRFIKTYFKGKPKQTLDNQISSKIITTPKYINISEAENLIQGRVGWLIA